MPEPAPTDLFLSLTPHKVIEAVEASGVLCNRVCYPLNSFENRVYEVECEDRSRVIAKFYRPGRWTARADPRGAPLPRRARSEAEVPVCADAPVPDGDDAAARSITSAYCLFPRTGGRAPDELDDALVERLGRLIARIHNVGAARRAPHRMRLSADTLARERLAWLEAHDVVPARLERRYLDGRRRASPDLADERLAACDVHRIHGDLHLGNLLLRDGVFHVLDFDDMMVGPAVQDVWLLLPGRDADARRHARGLPRRVRGAARFDRATLR